MLFGLPWFAWIAIVAIAGGYFVEIKKNNAKNYETDKRLMEEMELMRKTAHGLRSRIENLEAIVANSDLEEEKMYDEGRISNDLDASFDKEKEANRNKVAKAAAKRIS